MFKLIGGFATGWCVGVALVHGMEEGHTSLICLAVVAIIHLTIEAFESFGRLDALYKDSE